MTNRKFTVFSYLYKKINFLFNICKTPVCRVSLPEHRMLYNALRFGKKCEEIIKMAGDWPKKLKFVMSEKAMLLTGMF